MQFSVLDVTLLALCLLCVASALDGDVLDDSDLRGIKSLKRKFRNMTMGNQGRKSKGSKKDNPSGKPEHQELFPGASSDGSAAHSESSKCDQKYSDILKSIASLASNQREILDRVIAFEKAASGSQTGKTNAPASVDMTLISSHLKNSTKEIIAEVRKVITSTGLCAPTAGVRPNVLANDAPLNGPVGNSTNADNAQTVPPGQNKCDIEMKRIEILFGEVKVKADAINKSVAAISKRTTDLESMAAAINTTANVILDEALVHLSYEVSELRTSTDYIYDSVGGISNNISETTTEISQLHNSVKNITTVSPAPNQVHLRMANETGSLGDANCAALSKDLTKSSEMHKELMNEFKLLSKMHQVFTNLTLITLDELKSDHQQMKIGLYNVTEQSNKATVIKQASQPDSTGALATQEGTNINATFTLIKNMHTCIMQSDMCLNTGGN